MFEKVGKLFSCYLWTGRPRLRTKDNLQNSIKLVVNRPKEIYSLLLLYLVNVTSPEALIT